MSKRRAFLLLFFCLAAVLPALGNREKDSVVQVTGRVRLVGNEPFPELIIWKEEGSADRIANAGKAWFITREDRHLLIHLQHRTVTVEGKETVEELSFVSGNSAGQRHTLSNIRIISVE